MGFFISQQFCFPQKARFLGDVLCSQIEETSEKKSGHAYRSTRFLSGKTKGENPVKTKSRIDMKLRQFLVKKHRHSEKGLVKIMLPQS